MYLLDSDHLIILQQRRGPEWINLRARLLAIERKQVFASVVSFHEQMLGANTYISRAKNFAAVVRGYQMMEECLIDFNRFQVLPFDEPSANEFDRLRRQGIRIGTMDLRIASTAISHGCRVVTRNEKDFGQVPGLAVEDWTIDGVG